MFTIKRRPDEELVLNDESHLTIISTSTDRLTLKVTVPADVRVRRIAQQDSLDCEPVLILGTETAVP